MKKSIVILSVLLVLVIVAGADATETRVHTMGDNNILLLDETNVFLFPSRIYEWPDLAVGEFGDNDFKEFGIHWKFGSKKKPGFLGTYFHNNSAVGPELANSPFFADPYNLGYNYGRDAEYIPFDKTLLSNQRLDLIYGRKMGKNHLGLHVKVVHSSQRNNIPTLGFPTEGKDDESYGSYGFTLGMTSDEGKYDIAAGVDFMTFKDKGTDDAGAQYDETMADGNARYHIVGRKIYQRSDSYTFIPHIALDYAKYNADYYDEDVNGISLIESNNYTQKSADLGVGVQYTPASKVLAVLDFGTKIEKLAGKFRSATGPTREASLKTFVHPYFKVGFDADVFKWLDIRMGAVNYWKTETYRNESVSGKHVRSFSDNETFLGFGFHWNRLHVDTQTDPDLFLRGFDFINGKDNSNDMNLRISIVYEMK